MKTLYVLIMAFLCLAVFADEVPVELSQALQCELPDLDTEGENRVQLDAESEALRRTLQASETEQDD